MENRINISPAHETQETVLQAVGTAGSAMPFLIKISDSERKSLQTIDDGRKPFVQKCIETATRNAALDPGPGMIEAATNDWALFSFLSTVENELAQLLEMVRDTKQVAGSEAYEMARFIYMKAKMNVKFGVPGSQTVVDEFSKLFKQTTAPAKPVGQ